MIKAFISYRVPFHDIDIMYVVWHGHYYKYFELARTALMQKIGLDWPVLKEMGIAMPVIDSGARYRMPLRYNDDVVIKAEILEYRYPALEVRYEISSATSHDVLTEGGTKQAYFEIETSETLLAVPERILKIFAMAEG